MEEAIEKTKKKLWQFGYSVKDVSDIPGLGYQLLVDGKYQVRIIQKGLDILDSTKKGVIVAIVGDDITYHICKGAKCWEETSPLKAFPKVDKAH